MAGAAIKNALFPELSVLRILIDDPDEEAPVPESRPYAAPLDHLAVVAALIPKVIHQMCCDATCFGMA